MRNGPVKRGVWSVKRRALRLVAAAALAVSGTFLPPSTLFSPRSAALAQQNDPAHQQFLFAYKLLQRGDNRLAADAFDDYLRQFPSDAKRGDALYYRALLYRRAGQNDRAAATLADVPGPQIVPAYAIDLLRGQVFSDLQRYGEAVAALNRIDVAALEPKVAVSVLYLRGLAQRGAENLPAAAADLKAAAELDSPMRGRAYLDLARVQVLMGHEQDAIATLRKAMDAPDAAAAAEAARMAGDLAYNAGEYADAVGFYGRVLAEHQSSKHFGASVIGTLWSHFSAGEYRRVLDAFERYRTALQVQDRVAAWYLAGSAQQEMGNHAEAVQLFDQIAHGEGRYPLREKVLYKLAASQFELGRYDAMAETIDRLTTQYPNSEVRIDAAFLLAAADAQRGDVAGGAARLTQLIDQGPQSPYYLQALLRRARLYETHNQLQPAAADYLAYLNASEYPSVGQRPDGGALLGPNDTQAGAFLRLLDVYQQLGQYELAAGLAKRWLETMRLPPMVEQEALYRRALSLVKLGQGTDALALLDRLQQQYPLSPFAAEASYYRGLLLLSMDRPEQAVPLLQQAAEEENLLRPLRANAMHLLALRQRNSEQPDAAARTLLRLESLAGVEQLTDAELLWLSRHLFDRGDANGALRYVQPLVEGRPNATAAARAEALFLAGRALRAKGELDAAEQALGQVIAMGAGFDLDARLELAKVVADRGNLEQAMAELSGLISSEVSEIAAESLYTAAMIQRRIAAQHRRTENHAGVVEANNEARKLLKRLVLLYPFEQVEPLPQLSYLELAEIEAELNELDAAAQELRELVAKYPDGAYATYAKAVLAADEKHYGDAVALLKTLQAKPQDPRLSARIEALLRVLERN